MHNLLETYLSEVAAHLGALPAKQRAEELREMRAHLLNAVIVNRELGQSEDEAVQSAVAQFGTPPDLGENIVWAWRRGETRSKRSFWGAVVSTPLMLLSLMLVMSHLPNFSIPWLDRYCIEHKGSAEIIGMALSRGMFLTVFMLAGAVVGCLSPKRAVRAACLGLVVFWIGWAVVGGVGRENIWRFLFNGDRVGWVLTAIVSAWVGSRWRKARIGRGWLARN